jgi:PIN domain nuclease of toxin-antitoxin system
VTTLLLDTHAFLWFDWGDPLLSRKARSLIEDEANQILVSVASIWEIAIKVRTGKLSLVSSLEDFLVEHLDGNDIELLGIERRHCVRLAELPMHHRDPFDRMLVAQSQVESIPLISTDSLFDAYGVTRLW